MPTINELNTLQQELLDKLFFEDDAEEQVNIEHTLDLVKLSAQDKLNFMTDMLVEVVANTSAREAVLDRAKARVKTAKNIEDRLRDYIKDAMIAFNIKKAAGEHGQVALCPGLDKVIYLDDFDVMSMPQAAVSYVPESYRPKTAEVSKILKSGVEIKGARLVRTPFIKLS